MTKMVERVARKIDPEAWVYVGLDAPGMPLRRDKSILRARDVIGEMREPTEAMLDAMHFDGPVGSMLAYDRIWQRGISAALEEEKAT